MRAMISTLLLIAVPLAASADAVVSKGGKPGAAKAWSTQDGAVVLELVPGFTADAVAAAIQKGVAGAKATVQDGKVAVTGIDEKKLLVALEKIDVSADDVDAMVSALQVGAAGDEGSGSSIRATKAADMSAAGGQAAEPVLVPGTVVSVKHGKYPYVAVTLKLDTVPKALADAGVKPGAKITVVPRVQLEGGRIAPSDERSKANIGAWYARSGDKIQVALEGQGPQGFWVAARFERAR